MHMRRNSRPGYTSPRPQILNYLQVAKARKALSSTEHVKLHVFLYRYSPMQRHCCWEIVQVEQALYSYLSRFLGGSKVKYSPDQKFIHKGIAL